MSRDLDPVTLPGGYPRPGFSSKRKASEYWHDTLGGRNDRARFVLEAGRWYIEEASGWNWHRWDAAEYVPHALTWANFEKRGYTIGEVGALRGRGSLQITGRSHE